MKQSSLFQYFIAQLTLCQRYLVESLKCKKNVWGFWMYFCRTIISLKLLSLSNKIVASLQYFYDVIDSEQVVFVKMLKINEQCLMILKAKLFNCKKVVAHFIIILWLDQSSLLQHFIAPLTLCQRYLVESFKWK